MKDDRLVLILCTQVKKEESSDSCKAEPMETSSASGEDRKPEVKSEAKEEEEGSGTAGTNSSPAAAQNKKKSMSYSPRSFVLDVCTSVDKDRYAYCI